MGRISRHTMFMNMARVASQRSTCFRLNVGAIVTHNNSPISIGWNGAEAGAPHCAGNDCPGVIPGNCGTIHAEHNALLKADKLMNIDLFMKPPSVDLYVTHSPCLECCEFILGSWVIVKNLFFEIPYRNTQHLGIFNAETGPVSKMKKVNLYEVTPAGYVVEYFSRKVVELP